MFFDTLYIFFSKGKIFLSTFGDYLRRKRTFWHVPTSNLTFYVQKIITQPRRVHFFRYSQLVRGTGTKLVGYGFGQISI